MNFINKQVKLLHKYTRGDITVQSIIKFLEYRGYDVVFFNTEDGDELLKKYGIILGRSKAITYCGITKIVFIDDSIHSNDKLYVLLHECGHILLGHINENQIHSIDKMSTENEAEAFAYKVLNYSPPKTMRNILLSVLASVLIIAGTTLVCSELFAAPAPSSVVQTSSSFSDEIVYVTPTGAKYHRPSCYYAKHHSSSRMYKSEAEKTRTPCSMCNP